MRKSKIKALVFILFISTILVRVIYVFLYDTRARYAKDREDAIANDVFLGDYKPSKKTMKSKTGLVVPLSDAYLYQLRRGRKTWYLGIERVKLDLNIFTLQALHESLKGYESRKTLHLTDNPSPSRSSSQSFAFKNGEKYFSSRYEFMGYQEKPDTIMIYLYDLKNISFDPSDSVAYIRVEE